MDKEKLRKHALEKRANLDSAYRKEAEDEIFSSIQELDTYQRADTIFIYYNTEEEMNVQPWIQEMVKQGKRVGIPRVSSMKNREMVFYDYQPGDQLETSSFGIEEPLANEAKALSANDADLVIMPCVTANTSGERLGYGGGFYDTFLEKYSGPTLLPIYDALTVDDIPMDPHDQLVDIVVTEKEVVFINK